MTEDGADAGDWVPPSLSGRLQRLFATRANPATGRPWTLRQVAAAVSDSGVTLSTTFLHQLRRGERDNPNYHQLTALARVFGVHPGYFLDDEAAVDRLDAEAVLRRAISEHPEVEEWAAQSLRMTPRDILMITHMIELTVNPVEAPPPHHD